MAFGDLEGQVADRAQIAVVFCQVFDLYPVSYTHLDVYKRQTTSSPCAFIRNSPYSFFSPVAGLRVNATPVPEVSPMLPNTIDWTLTAVPQECGM